MGRNESTVELLVKVQERIRDFLEVPNESTGSFFRHMRVIPVQYVFPLSFLHENLLVKRMGDFQPLVNQF